MDDTGVVLIVFWVVVVNPLVGYAIGERKGNVATGIILGLLLGPVGWLVTAMCFSNLRKCPFCSEESQAGSNSLPLLRTRPAPARNCEIISDNPALRATVLLTVSSPALYLDARDLKSMCNVQNGPLTTALHTATTK